MTKICSRCHKVLPRESFYLNRNVKSGLMTRCKSCDKEYHKFRVKRKREIFPEGTKRCFDCKQILSKDNFYKSRNSHHCRCKSCFSKYGKNNIKKYNKLWEKILQEKDRLTCIYCGYNKCFAALDFHHKDPQVKLLAVAQIIRRVPSKKALEEIDKTITLCSNCHRELHEKIRKQ